MTRETVNSQSRDQTDEKGAWRLENFKDGWRKLETRLWPSSMMYSSTNCGHSWGEIEGVPPIVYVLVGESF